MITLRSTMAALMLVAMGGGSALAHSTVKRTVPASGSVLTASPEQLVIEFNQPARLTSLAVAGEPERKLAFEPSGSATSFTAKAPQLASGRNEIKWKALSKDGHPISGTVVIVIKPDSKQ